MTRPPLIRTDSGSTSTWARHASPLRFREPHREAAGDHAGVQPDGAEAAEEAGVLDLAAAVHDHLQARLARPLGGLLVDHSELHPEHPGPDLNGLLRDLGHLPRRTKDVHDLDLVVLGRLRQVRVDAPTQDLAASLRG